MKRADAEALLRQLVSFPTVSAEPNEALIGFAHDWLRTHGARVSVVSARWRRDGFNLHAVLGPGGDGGILLAAHTDVVAVEGQSWTGDPFQLRRSGDRLYGRGTADMKGFIAAALAAVATPDAGSLRRPLHLALSCDEELGCKGVGTLLDAIAEGQGRPSLCVIGEPTRMCVADRHKGKVSLRVAVRGRPAHSSIPARGVNAVTWSARLIGELDDLSDELADGPRDEAFAVPHATLSVGPIQGGVSLNIIPDHCTFDVELRYPPGDDPERLLGAIRQRAQAVATLMQKGAPEAGVDLTETASYPALSPSSEGVAAMRSLGVDGSPIAVDFGTEAGYYHERLGVPCVVFGPGDMAVAHRADEYLERAQLRAAKGFIERVLGCLADDRSEF